MTIDRVSDYFSAAAKEFAANYERSSDFQERWRVWTDLVARYAPRRGRALDMGCGPGFLTFHLAERGLDTIGIDAADGMIRLCEETKARRGILRASFIRAEIPVTATAPLAGADLIVSSSLLEYVTDLSATLLQFAALLSPGGVLILSLPNRRSLYRAYERWSFRLTGRPEYYRFVRNVRTVAEIEALLLPLGLTRLETAWYGHEPLISRAARVLLSPERSANLFAAAFHKQGT